MLTAPGRAVRLRQYKRDVEACGMQGSKRDAGELRGAGECQPHARSDPASALVIAPVFQHLGLDTGALERAQVINKNLAHQVIHFVLHALGQQALGIELHQLTLTA